MHAYLRLSLICLMTIGFQPLAHGTDRPGWKRYETNIAYANMIKRLNGAVKAEKMGLVSRASASSGAKRRKIKILGNMVVGVYRNDFAIRMLEASLDAGIEAPIRFYLTERQDGGTTLSYKTPSHVFAPYMEAAKPDLKALAGELDDIFEAIATRASNGD